MLIDNVREYYLNGGYNCAESVVRGANDYYQLGLHDHDMKMIAAMGAGVQTGNFCGALAGATCVLSMMFVVKQAHESTDITTVTSALLSKFEAKNGTKLCAIIKPKMFVEGIRCLHTVELACACLEEVIEEYSDLKKI